MKNLLFAALLLVFAAAGQSASAATLQTPTPEIKFVVSAQRIWVMADESIYSLPIEIKNAAGKVVLEKEFTAKNADWSVNVESLPAGTYTVHVRGKEMTNFRRI